MSYALRRAGLGDFSPWSCMSCHLLSPSSVYVLRLGVTGAPLASPADAMLFARALGQGQNLELDVRGVAVSPVQGGVNVDVVTTVPDTRFQVPIVADDAASMAKQVAADPALSHSYPNLSIGSSQFGQLTAPQDAIDHWLSQPLLWDHQAPPGPRGGPTASFADPAPYSIVHGLADDGARAVPWVAQKVPIGPNTSPGAAPGSPAVAGSTILLGAVLLLGAAWIAVGSKQPARLAA